MMKNKVIVCGSIAYDYLMNFDGDFNEVIGSHDLNSLSVSFLANKKERHFGGCGANIAYNMGLLGLETILFAAVGQYDFGDYKARLDRLGVNTGYLALDENNDTSSAYILSDNGARQIAMFHPGASSNIKLAMDLDQIVKAEGEQIKMLVLSPENPQRVFSIAQEAIKYQIPYFFDPGQITHVFDEETLSYLINNAECLIANEFEFQIIEEKCKLSTKELAKKIPMLVCTLGEKGSLAYLRGEKHEIDALKPEKFVDATGCGDAFRAGFIKGLIEGREFQNCLQMGTIMGTIVAQEHGTQTHQISLADFDRYLSNAFK